MTCHRCCAGPGAAFLRGVNARRSTRRTARAEQEDEQSTYISQQIFEASSSFLRERCVSGSISTERGGAFKHLHIQGVLTVQSTSSTKIKNTLRKWLTDHVQNWAELKAYICCKKASNKGLHTFQGLVAYSMKYEGHDDYQNVMKNVGVLDIEEGRRLLREYGNALKNRIGLNLHNLMERAATFSVFELREKLQCSLHMILWAMMRSGQYYADPAWVVSHQGKGMQPVRAHIAWRTCIAPGTITPADVWDLFFEQAGRYFDPQSVEFEMSDDVVLRELVEEAEAQQKDISAIIDSRRNLRPLLFERGSVHVLRQHPQPAHQPFDLTYAADDMFGTF